MTDFEISASHPRTRGRSGMVALVCVIFLWFAAIGLFYVLTKNRIHALGGDQRQVEKEIAALQQEMRAQNLQIEEALSRKNLMEKLSMHRSKLKAIRPDSIVRLTVNPTLSSLPENK
jgi:hypothetical protein